MSDVRLFTSRVGNPHMLQAACPPACPCMSPVPSAQHPSMASTVAYRMPLLTECGSQRDPLHLQILDNRQSQLGANRIMQQSFIVCMQAQSRLWEQFFRNSLKAMRKILIRPILKVMETSSLNNPDIWVRKPDCLHLPYIWHKLKYKVTKPYLASVGKQGT